MSLIDFLSSLRSVFVAACAGNFDCCLPESLQLYSEFRYLYPSALNACPNSVGDDTIHYTLYVNS